MVNLVKDRYIKKNEQQERIGIGISFGTFGELLQGVLQDNNNFLVTMPIECYSRAKYISNKSSNILKVFPTYKTKSLNLANHILKHFNLQEGGILAIESNLSVGKGLASSSADLVATSRAISDYYGIDISNTLLNRFMREIEPSDGVMYDGIVSFYHRKVRLCKYIGNVPPLSIVGIDEGGVVDTIAYNKVQKEFTDYEKKVYEQLLNTITKAIKEKNINEIGRIATKSALMNQRFIYKKNLHKLIEICEEVDGLGVIVTHSGTCLGILLSTEDVNFDTKLFKVKNKLYTITDDVFVYHSWRGKLENMDFQSKF
ncbi:MAG: kinase [Firmicutes bacterium]|nr:kinase [Bacillota bacterium]